MDIKIIIKNSDIEAGIYKLVKIPPRESFYAWVKVVGSFSSNIDLIIKEWDGRVISQKDLLNIKEEYTEYYLFEEKHLGDICENNI